ncbi:hypothetical protein KI387_035641 [Taxus chinensis]|uniref:Uncharacterized protein n=1 Tax=Taxus chinensis TaxID=29808 RepID=A0AA38L0F8_TAXCH|nr:hypothetical protein KI387_035641 [Taxus chinensis]
MLSACLTVEDVNNLDSLISIIQECLEAMANKNDKGQQNTAAQETSSSSRFASYTDFGKNLVEEVLKRVERNRCMVLKFITLYYDAGDLQNLESQIKHNYQDLTLGVVIGVLDNIPQFHPPTQGEDPSKVGIEEAKYRVIRLLNMDPKDESKRAAVVYGVGVVGKTTLATAVFKSLDLKPYNFCRIDMDQNCSSDHIKRLQQQILRDLFGERIELRSFVDGQDELAKAFREASDKAIFLFIGKLHIVYAEGGHSLIMEKSEEHIRQMLLHLPRCSCACIPADDRTSQLFNFAVYKLFESGSSDATLSSHTCIVGLRVGLQRDNKLVKFQTDCFPSNYEEEEEETRKKDDLQAMIDPTGGLNKVFSLLNMLSPV